jgi:hypothetical protein
MRNTSLAFIVSVGATLISPSAHAQVWCAFCVASDFDYSVEMTLLSSNPVHGDTATYNITVRNEGDLNAAYTVLLWSTEGGLYYDDSDCAEPFYNDISPTPIGCSIPWLGVGDEHSFIWTGNVLR